MTSDRVISTYRDSSVLVTGGLGFIGSSLAERLAALGAHVTVVDSSVPGCGANPHNLSCWGVRVVAADIGDPRQLDGAFRGVSVIFNLAGEISHIHSMRRPERDAELNATAQLRFLEECARQAPGVRVVYAGTRQVYGVPHYSPVDEAHPVGPVDFNGVHKYLACAYHDWFTSAGRLDAVVLRLTNIYGPRMALNIPCQGFLGTFFRRALRGEPIEIFGDGRQVRDPVYVDDIVDAFLMAGAVKDPAARMFNAGGSESLTIARMATMISAAAEAPAPVFRPFPTERRKIDIGSYTTDSGLIEKTLGWQPRVRFEEGIRKSLEYYKTHLKHYLYPEGGEAGCGEAGCALEAPERALAGSVR